MGEYAEMMLEGTLCECCGEYIGNAVGYTQYCSNKCANDRGISTIKTEIAVLNCTHTYLKKCDNLIERFIKSIEKTFGVPFLPEIKDRLSHEINGSLSKLYIKNGKLVHSGIEKNLTHNKTQYKKRK